MYQTLDAVDGKQARRTGTSSPLGQLFDHGIYLFNSIIISLGCDSVAVFFGLASFMIAVRAGSSWMGLAVCFSLTVKRRKVNWYSLRSTHSNGRNIMHMY